MTNEYQNEKLHKCKQIKGIPQESVKVAQPFVDFSLETSEVGGNKHRSPIIFEGVYWYFHTWFIPDISKFSKYVSTICLVFLENETSKFKD